VHPQQLREHIQQRCQPGIKSRLSHSCAPVQPPHRCHVLNRHLELSEFSRLYCPTYSLVRRIKRLPQALRRRAPKQEIRRRLFSRALLLSTWALRTATAFEMARSLRQSMRRHPQVHEPVQSIVPAEATNHLRTMQIVRHAHHLPKCRIRIPRQRALLLHQILKLQTHRALHALRYCLLPR
jgi:hypothetical protein